jgi:transcriptional regulator with XRE-family HTH domain
MARSTDRNLACLRVRVTTRLAWLDITQVDFAAAIGMDKSSLSRVMRADSPRQRTMHRIALGLGLEVDDLTDRADPLALVGPHPAIDREMPRSQRAHALSEWYAESSRDLAIPPPRHRSERDRHARRMEVRQALDDGTFNLEFVRKTADKYGVSTSQIYADRTRLQKTETGSGDAAFP